MDFKKSGLYRFAYNAYHLYVDGFRNMTLGKTLWAVILIKLFIIFAILKLFFFPNFIHENAEKGQESEFVSTQILERTE
jgi:hypothetical protein